MKLLNMDYVGDELVKDLQSGFVFKCKKKKDNLNLYAKDSIHCYFNLVLTIDDCQGELFGTNSTKERKFSNVNRANYRAE